MTLTRIDKDYLTDRFDITAMDIKFMPRDGVVNKLPAGEITAYYKNIPLYRWSFEGGSLEILCPGIFSGDIIEAIDRTGLYPLEFELNSQGTGVHEESHDNVKILESHNGQEINDFMIWFDGKCSSIGNRIYLIPDTNFLRRHYYSNFLMNILSRSRLIYSTRIVTPRNRK
jgi:hypothetical protein